MADWYHERIEMHVNEFAKGLKDNELLAVDVILNDGTRLNAQWFGYHNPNMITVSGTDSSGREVQALLPHTNIQIVMTKMRKSPGEKKGAIGFQTRAAERS